MTDSPAAGRARGLARERRRELPRAENRRNGPLKRHPRPRKSPADGNEKIAKNVLLVTLVCLMRNAKIRTHRRSRDAALIVPAATMTC